MSADDFRIVGVTLFDWQNDAVRAWAGADPPFRGTLEIFTGGGKSLIALACAREAAAAAASSGGDFRLFVVVPTKALADQWTDTIAAHTSVARERIGRLTTANAATVFDRHDVVVSVINTAAKLASTQSLRLPERGMLVVDECHRAGAPSFRSVLALGRRFRLGLSATPEREELGEDGEPLAYDEQIVAKRLGRVVYSFGLADARRVGRLPDYEIHHHGIALLPDERRGYDAQSGEVDDLSRRLRAAGVEPGRARAKLGAAGTAGDLARAYLAATASRKDLLYRASERGRVALSLVRDAMHDARARVLVFNERIDAVRALEESLRATFGTHVEIEHSQLAIGARRAALARFRSGDARILISAKSLIEGIDVPDATVGISVASTASVRQRVQALGRVLRKGAGPAKRAVMHVVYVSDSVDESIYEKEDWSDLTGASRNRYFRWDAGAVAPHVVEQAPRKPRPTETQMAESFAASGVTYPSDWPGAINGQEYSVDTKGLVKNAFGTGISNGQGVGAMVLAARGTPGGRLRITPRHRFVLVYCHTPAGVAWRVAGKLAEAFESRDVVETVPRSERDDVPGQPYLGPANRANGEFKLRSRSGGIIERRNGGRATIARVDENAARTLANWRRVAREGLTFFVNDDWDAWFERDGVPVFLARVGGGFDFQVTVEARET